MAFIRSKPAFPLKNTCILQKRNTDRLALIADSLRNTLPNTALIVAIQGIFLLFLTHAGLLVCVRRTTKPDNRTDHKFGTCV